MGLVAHQMRDVLDRSDPPLEYAEYQRQAHTAADAVAAYHLSNGKKLVAGHFWYGKYLRLLDSDVHRMTVIREPVSRFLSHYRYLVWKFGLKSNLSEFLESDQAKHLGSIYGFYFANRYPSHSGEEDEIVEQAVRTLNAFSLIGDVKLVSEFLREARNTIGGPLICLRSNQTPRAVQPEIAKEVTVQDQQKIEQLTSVDRRIYQEVVGLPNYVVASTNVGKPFPNGQLASA